jgi:hypothetical protein
MRLILIVALFFGLIALSVGDTAKEAHDKSVECAKKCSRYPSVLRCEMQCKNPHPTKEEKTKKTIKSRIRPNKVVPKKSRKTVTTIKGRRVYLVKKN